MSKINIDGSGRLELPVSVVKEIGAASLELVCHSNAHLLFSNVESGFQLAGVLGEIAMVDVLSFLNMFRKTGSLVVSLAGGQKEVGFLRGEIVAAESSFPEEDICGVLLEMGKLDQEAMSKYRQLVNSCGGSGRVLVEKGVIAPRICGWRHVSRWRLSYSISSVPPRGVFSFLKENLRRTRWCALP